MSERTGGTRATFRELALRHYLSAASVDEANRPSIGSAEVALFVASEIFSVLVIVWTCVELVANVEWAATESIALDVIASAVFVADWVVGLRFHLRHSRRENGHRTFVWFSYLVHPGHMIDLLSGVAPLAVIAMSDVLGLGMLRFVRVLRSAARLLEIAHEFAGGPSERELRHPILRTTGLIAATVALVLVVSQAVYRVEHLLPGTTFRTRGDALWWGLVTVTTIGYGDIYPKTTEGRVLAGMLMLFGIGVVASMTALIAEYYIRKPQSQAHGSPARLQKDLTVLREYLERIEQDVRELRVENERLRERR